MALAIEVEGLRKSYRSTQALDGLDLMAATGSILGVLGPNGAGKTTAVRILATLLRPDAGRALVAGFDVVRQPAEVRQRISLTGQYAALDEHLTGRENLELVGDLDHLPRVETRRLVGMLLERLELVEAADRPVQTYSGGMRRRLDLAAGIMPRAEVMVLDEPTTGLDPRGRLAAWELIEELVANGATVLLTTQHLEEAERLATRIAMVDRGRVVASGTSAELKARVGGERLVVGIGDRSDLAVATATLRRFADGDPTADADRRQVSVPVIAVTRVVAQAVRALDDADIEIVSLGIREPTLDDAFLALTGSVTSSTGGIES
jgi:ABC-2 type transport system ATP-binding protein